MPIADELIAETHMLRVFIYGPAKMRKTWWALNAAEAGFRVLMFSGERGHGIVQRLSPEARKRVYIIDAHDGALDGFFATSLVTAFRTGDFGIHEKKRLVATPARGGFTRIDMREFGAVDVVVIDSYTAFAESLARRYAFENNIDLADASKPQWEGYRYCGMLASWFLTQLEAVLHCHYVVVGHQTQYEKYEKDPNDPKKQGPLEFSRQQPISTSNPHAMSISGKFDHVLHFGANNPQKVIIDTLGDADHDAGSRALPNGRYTWEELTFAELARRDGCTMPTEPTPPYEFIELEDRLSKMGKKEAPTSENPAPIVPQAAAPATIAASPARPSFLKRK